MKTVLEHILTHSNQMGSENRQLFTSLRKAYERLKKVHTGSEWAEQPMPALATYREKLMQYISPSPK